MNLSYMILHFNRPYLLEINIKLLRKYAPDMQIVVADDGSHPDVIKKISKLPIDNLYVQTANNNTWSKGTCSTTIKKARKLCSKDYFMFSEDDFLFCGHPLEQYDATEETLMPPVIFPSVNEPIFEKSIALLNKFPNIKNVQLSKDNRRVPTHNNFVFEGTDWEYVDHATKTSCYYSNWPSMLRKQEYFNIGIAGGSAIWSFEGIFSKSVTSAFGAGDWAVAPPKRYYVHVGMPFSKRLNHFVHSKKRSAYGCKIQLKMFKKVINDNIQDFNQTLLKSYLKGRFFIDFDEMMSDGLDASFVSAFERLSHYV